MGLALPNMAVLDSLQILSQVSLRFDDCHLDSILANRTPSLLCLDNNPRQLSSFSVPRLSLVPLLKVDLAFLDCLVFLQVVEERRCPRLCRLQLGLLATPPAKHLVRSEDLPAKHRLLLFKY